MTLIKDIFDFSLKNFCIKGEINLRKRRFGIFMEIRGKDYLIKIRKWQLNKMGKPVFLKWKPLEK